MDSRAGCECHIPPEPPAYKFVPKVPKNRLQMILISVVLVLLAIIIIGAILIGVYMTQEHTERVVKTVTSGLGGEVVEQTMMVNQQENVVAFQIQSNTTMATVVYEYKHRLIGFRVQDKGQCSVVAMDSVQVPSLAEITHRIEHLDEKIPMDDNMAYSFKQGELADRTTLGTTLNILCSDVPVYWAENKRKVQRGWVVCPGITIFGICYCF